MALHGLLAEEQPDADFPVHEPIGDQLEHLDLPGGRILPRLLGRRLEGDDLRDGRVAPRCDGIEPGRVLAVARKDLVALSSVHGGRIGMSERRFSPG